MNTQNTPVHISLWHRGFWFLAIANMLVSMSVYSMVAVSLVRLPLIGCRTDAATIASMFAFCLGLFSLGGFCSYLIQRYRRNIVCMWTLALMACSIAPLYYFDDTMGCHAWLVVAQRFVCGALFGLAEMILMSTLIIDTSESYQRTEANHCSGWFSRFALALGPLTGLSVGMLFGYRTVILTAIGLIVAAIVLIKLVHFPFRAPEETVHLYSLDRFFLPQGTLLFVNLILVTFAVGLLYSQPWEIDFFTMVMAGFFLAIMAQRFAFQVAELKSEAVAGLIMLIGSILILITHTDMIISHLSPVLLGCGLGILGSRFLLFFVKLSRHCKRGTSVSSFILGWDGGIMLGIGSGLCWGLFSGDVLSLLVCSLTFTVAALVMYLSVTHSWFLRHKNR